MVEAVTQQVKRATWDAEKEYLETDTLKHMIDTQKSNLWAHTVAVHTIRKQVWKADLSIIGILDVISNHNNNIEVAKKM